VIARLLMLLAACTLIPVASLGSEVNGGINGACIIHGIVADERGEQLQNVHVTIGQDGQTTLTGQAGAFSFEHLPPGRYQLWAHAAGYSSAVSDMFFCGPGQVRQLYLVIARFTPGSQL
jgi:Carboxypeptidase regulatory-like domain